MGRSGNTALNHALASTHEVRLRDERGRFIKGRCPECGEPLQYDGEDISSGEPTWCCTGLIAPEDDSKPLEACPYRTTGRQEHPRREDRAMSEKLRLYDEMCPRCGNDQVSAMVDDRIPEDHAADGDIVTCTDCGLQGLFDIDDQAECANVIWDEYAIEDYP